MDFGDANFLLSMRTREKCASWNNPLDARSGRRDGLDMYGMNEQYLANTSAEVPPTHSTEDQVFSPEEQTYFRSYDGLAPISSQVHETGPRTRSAGVHE